MKKIILILTIALSQNLFSQECYDFEWAKGASGNSDNVRKNIVTDTSGNIYVLGFSGLLTKFNPQGQILWQNLAGYVNTSSNGFNGLAIDALGNSYIIGYFKGSITLGSTTLTSIGGSSYYDIVVAKIDPQGQFIWAVKAGGSGSDVGNSIAVDALGNSYITGYCRGGVFGSINLSGTNGQNSTFVAKLNPQGQFLWATKAGGSGVTDYANGNKIATDTLGNSYVTGEFDGTVAFGSTTLTSSGNSDIFIAKLDPQGQFLWTEKAGGSGSDVGNSIVADALGNSYITGTFTSTAIFGATTLSGYSGGSDVFVAKLDPQGQFLWVTRAGGTGNDVSNDIVADTSGNSYVVGEFSGAVYFGTKYLTGGGGFITKLDPQGQFVWTEKINSSVNSVAVDASGNRYITGKKYSGATTFGGITLSGSGTFVAKLSVAKISLSATTTNIICGNSTQLQVSSNIYISAGTSGIYYWSPTNSLTGANTAKPTAKPTSTTKYTVLVNMPIGCSVQDTIIITVSPSHQVNVSATKTAIMCGDSTQLQASVTGNVSNIGYSWGLYSSPITGANTNTLIATPKNTTTYYSSTYISGGCVVVDSITITVNPYQVNASATKTEIACGGSTKLHVTETNGATYAWSPNSTLTGENTANPTASPTSTTTYTVSSSVTGCGTATDNITITVDAYTPQLFTHTTNELTATFTNTEENAVSYAWNFGDGNTSTSENPTHTYATDGTYNVCLTLTNTCSETETVCANVTVTKEVGVQNIAAQATWSVYPNPTNSTFTVANAPNGASLSITDLSGKTVYTSRIVSEQTSIETTTFTSGIYFVNVMFEGVTTMHKVVVTK